ncbi:MAG: glycerophosphodiester phosphodiesterase family protein, partial [Myxococcota bacterium]
DELKRLDAGAHFTGPDGDRYGARIPTLDQVLERFPNARFNIEMKVDGLELSLCDALRVHHALARSLVASASRERLARFREACPSVATSAALSEVLVFWGLANLGIAGSAPAPALQIPHSAPVFWPPIRWAAQRRGMVVQVFTVNEPGAMDSALRAGAHGVMTDRPDLLLERAGRE